MVDCGDEPWESRLPLPLIQEDIHVAENNVKCDLLWRLTKKTILKYQEVTLENSRLRIQQAFINERNDDWRQ